MQLLTMCYGNTIWCEISQLINIGTNLHVNHIMRCQTRLKNCVFVLCSLNSSMWWVLRTLHHCWRFCATWISTSSISPFPSLPHLPQREITPSLASLPRFAPTNHPTKMVSSQMVQEPAPIFHPGTLYVSDRTSTSSYRSFLAIISYYKRAQWFWGHIYQLLVERRKYFPTLWINIQK